MEWIEQKLDTKIPFTVIADYMGRVSEELELHHEESSTATVRAGYIVNPDSTIRALLFYPLEMGRNKNEILRMLTAFQVGEEHDAAISANWPNYEVVGEDIIVPPPGIQDEAMKRCEKYECLDWWLCLKKHQMMI
jgi:peroxiredoxin (alkyl hydroperoxide reductase subunit C)